MASLKNLNIKLGQEAKTTENKTGIVRPKTLVNLELSPIVKEVR